LRAKTYNLLEVVNRGNVGDHFGLTETVNERKAVVGRERSSERWLGLWPGL
jgi:hypothetical protein